MRKALVPASEIGNGVAAARMASAKPTISCVHLHPQSHEERRNLRVGAISREHFRITSRASARAAIDRGWHAMEGVKDHGALMFQLEH